MTQPLSGDETPKVPVGSTDAAAQTADPGVAGHEEVGHFRGSTVLVFGRFIGLGLDLVTQVIIVRALTRTEFGAFAFGLSVASFAATIALLGLDKTISRFVPLYEEQQDERRLAGSLVVAFGIVAAVSAFMVLVLIGLEATLGDKLVENQLAREMLLILFLMAPIRAFDSLMTSTFATFGSTRSIVIRRNIIAPGLQLLVVLVVLVADQPPRILALGYVAAGALGIALFASVLARQLRMRGIARRIRRRDVALPGRALLSFSLPLLSSDVVMLLRTSVVVILLQYLGTSREVAAYGAVLPLARQNLVIYQSFAFLFVPLAARLYARREDRRLRDMYWRTAAWIAVATFPALVMSVPLAGGVTVLLFGPSYADSATVLAVLAIGHFVSAALGFNSVTLRVQGAVRLIVVVDVFAAIISVGGSILLIPIYGALGAAVATSATLIAQNLLYQRALARSSVGVPERRHVMTFVAIAAMIALLCLLQYVFQPWLIVGVVLGGIAWLVLLLTSRRSLGIATYFPELLRIPGAKRLLVPAETETDPHAP